MNRITLYSVISVIGAAVVIFVFLGNGSFNRVFINGDVTRQTTHTGDSATSAYTPNAAAITVKPIYIRAKTVASEAIDNRSTATIRIAFDVHNPNTNTMILDGIHYNLYINNVPIASGNIGTEAPEDIIRSQNG